MESQSLIKRVWWYLAQPFEFEIPGCEICGNNECQWSEFEDYLWCSQCTMDFIPKHWGIFDCPIPMKVCQLMSINFDRVLADGLVHDPFDFDTGTWRSDILEKKDDVPKY